jgi:hypothetical protein
MIHMIDQIQTLGPLYLHEMWTYECFISILNRYILNHAYPEGSMIKGYGTEEIIECCLGYLTDKVGIGLPVPCFLGRLEGVGLVRRKSFIDKDFKGVQQAHYRILQHLMIMTHLLNEHLSMIRAENNGRLDDWIIREHMSHTLMLTHTKYKFVLKYVLHIFLCSIGRNRLRVQILYFIMC